MRCKYCGTKLFPSDRWCPACGANPPDGDNPDKKAKSFQYYGMMYPNEIRQEINLPVVYHYSDEMIVGIGGSGGDGYGLITKKSRSKERKHIQNDNELYYF